MNINDAIKGLKHYGLIKHLIETGREGKPWHQIADEWQLSTPGMTNREKRDRARLIWKDAIETIKRRTGHMVSIKKAAPVQQGDYHEIETTGNEIETTSRTTDRLYTVEEHAEFHGIDTQEWEPAHQKSNYWEMAGSPQHQLKVSWQRKDKSLEELRYRQNELEVAFRAKHIEPGTPGRCETWIVLFCVHVPYQNKRLFESVLKYINENPVDGLILGGDFLDIKSLSGYDSDNVQDISLGDEYIAGHAAIMDIESVLPEHAKKIFLYGNHEDRYIRLLKSNTYNKLGAAFVSPERALKLKEKGWRVLTNWKDDYVLLGNTLEVFHGSHINQNAAATHLSKSAINGRSCLFGHTHRFQMSSTGKFSAYNVGTLCDINNLSAFGYVDRHTRQAWQNGFALVYIDQNGDNYVHPVKCRDDGFFIGGKYY